MLAGLSGSTGFTVWGLYQGFRFPVSILVPRGLGFVLDSGQGFNLQFGDLDRRASDCVVRLSCQYKRARVVKAVGLMLSVAVLEVHRRRSRD